MVQNTEYRRNINQSILILTVQKDCGKDRDSMEMFRYNKIPYFLCMQAIDQGSSLQFHYDITGRRSLDQLLEYKILDYALLSNILNSFDQACMRSSDYMLNEHDILLDPAYIFAESESPQLCYCYLPGNETDICVQFKRFMEYLLQRLDHKDKRAVQFAYGVYEHVAEEKKALHTVLAEFTAGNMAFDFVSVKQKSFVPDQHDTPEKKEIKEIYEETAGTGPIQIHPPYAKNGYGNNEDQEREDILANRQTEDCPVQAYGQTEDCSICLRRQTDAATQVNSQMSAESIFEDQMEKKKAEKAKKTAHRSKTRQKEQKESAQKHTGEKLKDFIRKKLYTDSVRRQEEEILFEEEREEETGIRNPTVCLMPAQNGIHKQFIYQGADRTRDFPCTKGKKIVGSSEAESNICIALPLISRVHAMIDVDDTGTYLEDLNSKNGTQVNGELLQYRERRLLKKGDIVSFAGENYRFS
ncbi:MAG: FHA domain-containing protein [Eubacterium sp.]|nr:FHA domain-containing protein [Eubacterium sp.]